MEGAKPSRVATYGKLKVMPKRVDDVGDGSLIEPVIRVKRKKNLPKPVRNIFISAAVLLVLLVGGGVAYTYYADQSAKSVVASSTVPVSHQTDQAIKPTQPAANAPEGEAIEVLSSPVTRGTSAAVSVQTLPESRCVISVVYGSLVATDPGLATKVADGFGSVSWSWTVISTAPIGTWPVKITCIHNGKAGFVEGSLQVTD